MAKKKDSKQSSFRLSKVKDFHKVKFKVGKKLPKNLNETRATFKAKTLILKQQFQTEKSGPVSHRNLSWKELLAHLGHYNQSIKLDALNSLREMITNNDEIIRFEFSNLLENVCPLFTDRDYKVREAAIQLLKTLILLPLFKDQNSLHLQPFYGLINVHLSCAMTHIVDNVQYSSLKLLDILIDNLPELIRTNAYSIFENFIEQISKASLKGDKRVLKNDPYKLTSTQTWRLNVLTRLYKMLMIVNKSFSIGSDLSKPLTLTIKIKDNEKEEQICLNQYSHIYDDKKVPIKISRKLAAKKDLNDLNEFYNYYLKTIAPLLIDCWLEAKPENKNMIDNCESLGIMYSVLAIFNTLFENLNLSIQDLTKLIKIPKSTSQENYIESMFLYSFPYSLAENFEYTSEFNKIFTNQINSNSINLLLCKFFANSLLNLNDEIVIKIFEYCLASLDSNSNTISSNELQVILKLSNIIFRNFKITGIIKPFLTALVNYFDNCSKFSSNKWTVFEFLAKEFYENDNLLIYENTFLGFYKKLFKFLITNDKEKKFDSKKLEVVIDWIRKLIIRKEKSNKIVLQLLEDEYINILNSLDFESQDLNDSCKKKALELIFWLPKVNRYLFTKLAILILNKNLSLFNTNLVLTILKLKLENSDRNEIPPFDQSDYLMFLIYLFNGYSSFDLMYNMSNNNMGQLYVLDNARFSKHIELSHQLEKFISSHKNLDQILELLLSCSIPILSQLEKGVYASTLYGSLCLISQIEDVDKIGSSYQNYVLIWLSNSLYWIMNKLFDLKSNDQISIQNNEIMSDLECINILLNKSLQILNKNSRILNDCVCQVASMVQLSKNLSDIKKIFEISNFLISKYLANLQPSKNTLFNLYNVYKGLNDSDYLWWQEFVNLIRMI